MSREVDDWAKYEGEIQVEKPASPSPATRLVRGLYFLESVYYYYFEKYYEMIQGNIIFYRSIKLLQYTILHYNGTITEPNYLFNELYFIT